MGSKIELPSSAQAPAKLGWVALFSANSTTHSPPPGKVYFAASIYPSILSVQALAKLGSV